MTQSAQAKKRKEKQAHKCCVCGAPTDERHGPALELVVAVALDNVVEGAPRHMDVKREIHVSCAASIYYVVMDAGMQGAIVIPPPPPELGKRIQQRMVDMAAGVQRSDGGIILPGGGPMVPGPGGKDPTKQ